ncbi:hypothetical protein E2C01_056120 [Portunus trituberculatus]|uniref:Uncharacterized protein n=1 Tax=Portunus trituberculatus TaxID=210409 RepID=A0A5B7GPJ6_PORTR|nr:hypothetical protein [Portunus trituberculatus]
MLRRRSQGEVSLTGESHGELACQMLSALTPLPSLTLSRPYPQSFFPRFSLTLILPHQSPFPSLMNPSWSPRPVPSITASPSPHRVERRPLANYLQLTQLSFQGIWPHELPPLMPPSASLCPLLLVSSPSHGPPSATLLSSLWH